jgi:hypothetical protein
MSDENKITYNEDLFLSEFEAFRTGEEHDVSCVSCTESQVMEDLNRISKLFSDAKPDTSEIPESADNIILGYIKEQGGKIRRNHKVVCLFPRYKWAAAAVIGVLVCVVSYNLVFKIDKSSTNPFEDKMLPPVSTELSKKDTVQGNNSRPDKMMLKINEPINYKTGLKMAGTRTQVMTTVKSELNPIPAQIAEDIDGNGRLNIIDAYIMDRRLMSGAALPEKFDLNGDGKINRDDVNSIMKTVVSLGRGDV